MIEAFSWRAAHLAKDGLAAQARLRHRVFVERRALPHATFDGMEYDRFDTPAAVYLVWRDAGGEARGLIRLLPTTRPYMMQTFWPEMVTDGAPPVSPKIWEITRVCVDKAASPRERRTILPELLCGVAEFFELNGISAMVGVARAHLVEHYIPQEGISWLGDAAEVEGEIERAFLVPTRFIRPMAHLDRLGVTGRVLNLFDQEDMAERSAA
jgi:N-acyl-L-homoserine lactone synthetase